jgi:hypothetical protein
MKKNLTRSITTFFAAALLVVCGFASSASAQVVINEIYGAGGNAGATYNYDYVELFNKGGTAVDLSTYSIQYASATGNFTAVTPLTGSIPSGGYYLIRLGTTNATVGAPLPVTPNVIGSTNISGTAGKVALVSNQTALNVACPVGNAAVVDFVGYGTTTTCAEVGGTPTVVAAGAGTAPAGSTTQSIQRTGLATDTGNNSGDFAAVAPSPQTTGPSAASVEVSGRVLSGSIGVYGARVYMVDQNGVTRVAMTNPFGYYRFIDVTVGESYTFNVSSKGDTFNPQIVTVNEELTSLDFQAID